MWATLGIALLASSCGSTTASTASRRSSGRALGVVVVALVAVFSAPPVNGARRWFGVGGLGIQPSELAKLAAIFFIAALLERRMHRINDLGYRSLPIGIVVGALVALILLEPDFGTSMSLAADRGRDGLRRGPELPLRHRHGPGRCRLSHRRDGRGYRGAAR